MKYRQVKILLILFIIPFFARGQRLATLINQGGFKKKYFITSFRDSINKYRKSINLPQFKTNEALTNSAISQAKYVLKIGKVTTSQPTEKKSTPFKRIKLQGGMFGETHELVAGVNLYQSVRFDISKRWMVINNQNQLIKYLMEKWTSEEDFKKILSSPNMYYMGVGVVPGNGVISIVCDFGSLPYIKPDKSLEINMKDYGLLPFDKKACLNLSQQYAYFKQLLTNNITVKNDTVYFHFYDKDLLKKVLNKLNDGIAVDYVTRNQFLCGAGNRTFPSKLHNGYLFKPVSASDIFKNNIYKKSEKIYTPVATIPSDMKIGKKDEFTLFIIQDRHVCQKIYYNNLDVEPYDLNNIVPVYDTLSATLTNDTTEKTLKFTIHFEKNKYDYDVQDIKPFLDSLQVNRYSIKNIRIQAYSSVEGSSKHNIELQNKRARSIIKAINEYKLSNIQMYISSQENWDDFFKEIKKTPYEKIFKGKSHKKIKAILASDTLSFNMESYLTEERKADITLDVRSILVDTTNLKKLAIQFKNTIEKGDIDAAKTIQPYIFHFISEGKMNREILKKINIPKTKEFLPLLNNKASLLLKADLNSLTKKKLLHYKAVFESLHKLNANYAYVNYNRLYVELMLWQKDTTTLSDPQAMENQIKNLYNSSIPNKKVDQLLLNYYFFATDYYFDRNDMKDRDKCLKSIKMRLVKPSLPITEAYKIAKYFIYQTHIPWAIEVMYPYIQKGHYSEDFLYTFLQIAFYDTKIVKPGVYYKLLEEASKKYPGRFCKLYGRPVMSFQHLKAPKIKQIYCKTCAGKN